MLGLRGAFSPTTWSDTSENDSIQGRHVDTVKADRHTGSSQTAFLSPQLPDMYQFVAYGWQMLASAAMQCLSPLMYERSDIRDLFKMVNAGLLDLGIREVLGEYGLDNYREAWDEAADSAGFARVTVMKP